MAKTERYFETFNKEQLEKIKKRLNDTSIPRQFKEFARQALDEQTINREKDQKQKEYLHQWHLSKYVSKKCAVSR